MAAASPRPSLPSRSASRTPSIRQPSRPYPPLNLNLSSTSPRRKRKLTARTADRHVLYQESVQSPEADARFFTRYFKKLAGRPLRFLREDFCGTALLCCEFV